MREIDISGLWASEQTKNEVSPREDERNKLLASGREQNSLVITSHSGHLQPQMHVFPHW